jgi:hypothetical protein
LALSVIAGLTLTSLALPTAAAAGPEPTVTYAGVTVPVPAGWDVVDLDVSDAVCVRLDRPTVYLGTPPEQQQCPARAVGRAETLWIGPTTAAEKAEAGGRSWARSTARGAIHRNEAAGEQSLVLAARGVSVRTTWGPAGERAGAAALDALTVSPDPQPVPGRRPAAERTPAAPAPPSNSPMPGGPKQHEMSVAPASFTGTLAAAAVPTGRPLYGGMAFDACAAPALTSLQAWRQSPYAAVGIYTSGSMRACPFRGGSAWVDGAVAQGWGLIPIHVGLQAPCVQQASLSLMSRDVPTARSQGVSEARVAIAGAQAVGLGAGSAIYVDLENYSMTDPVCSAATVAFVSGWTQELRRQGYVSGAYGGPGSLMRDMSNAVTSGDPTFVAPDHIWVAHWNQLQTTRDTYSPQFYPDAYWSQHQRMRQYAGDHTETWGGVALNIDSNWADLALPGNPVRTTYSSATTSGPGSDGFVFTGSMSYWRAAPGSGERGKAFWTGPSSSSTEFNGATWRMVLPAGSYRVEANVPDASTATLGRYTITDAQGSRSSSINQGAGSGWRPVGTALAQAGRAVTVHLGDNAGGDTTKRIWADAVRFVPLDAPAAPTAVTAVAGNGSAAISWTPGPAAGTSVQSYVVTAAPGGQQVTVGGASTTATITGLVNGTTYTFTVTASGSGGTGAASAPSNAVLPGFAEGFRALAPVRILDTRTGTTSNPGVARIPAGGSLRVRVAGMGTPIPIASSVFANATVVAGAAGGFLEVSGRETSLLNWAAGSINPNATTLPVASDGTVTLVNRSTAAIDLILDLQGYTSPGLIGGVTPVIPVRVLDSRLGTGLADRKTALAPGETIEVSVGGAAVPLGAEAALLRVTATEPAAGGFLTVSDSPTPGTSVVNFVVGQSVGNSMTARLSSAGTVFVTNNSTGRTHVILDAAGWMSPTGASLFRSVPQARLVDTRIGTVSNSTSTVLQAGETRVVKVGEAVASPIPVSARLVAVNVTVTNGSAGGWLAVGAGPTVDIPIVNYRPYEVRAGFGWVGVAVDGTVRIKNGSTGVVDVILDVHGHDATS